jgi:hypothetical protein
MPVTEAERDLLDVIADPVKFSRGILGHDVWDTPAAILRAMAQPHARVAVKACHASSKTFTAAELVLWALTEYERVKIVTTAPTWHQVATLLWGEIHKALAAAPIRLPEILAALNTTDIVIATGSRYAEGISTNEAVRFQGYHADEGGIVIVILDEAPGVGADIYEAINGIRAGGDVRVLAIGNPVVPGGPFYEAFHSQREDWETFTIDAFDTPNLRGVTLEQLIDGTVDLDHNPKPYLVTRRWVAEQYREYGEEHPFWQARVRAQFPTQADDSLFSLAWIEAAAQRRSVSGQGRRQAGIDVAGPGEDETVLYVREGPSIVDFGAWTGSDPRGDVAAMLAPHLNLLDAVVIDATGIGYNFAKHFKDLGYPVVEWNAGGEAQHKETDSRGPGFRNVKGEAYWSMRTRLAKGEINGLTDERTQAQLSTVRYKHNSRGQVEIESKDDAKKRGVKSPDRAEGLILAYYPVRARKQEMVRLPGGRMVMGR